MHGEEVDAVVVGGVEGWELAIRGHCLASTRHFGIMEDCMRVYCGQWLGEA